MSSNHNGIVPENNNRKKASNSKFFLIKKYILKWSIYKKRNYKRFRK